MSQNKTALITGASSGIGAEYAKQLAQRGFDLILTGRREVELRQLQQTIMYETKQQVEIIIAELNNPDQVKQIETKIKQCETLTVLINNAGYGTRSIFIKTPLEKHLAMINVHDAATVRFIHAALPNMIKRGHGSIINVSSLLSFMKQTFTVNYAATKVFHVALSRVLNKELKGTGVHIQCLCPGLTRSDFFRREELQDTTIYQKIPNWLWMTSAEVATISLNALSTYKTLVVPGLKNRFFHFVIDCLQVCKHLRFYLKKRLW